MHILLTLIILLVTWKDMCFGMEARGPRISENLPDHTDFSNDTGTVLTCRTSGNPSPVIKWIRPDGSVISQIQGLLEMSPNGSLHFMPFSATDYRHDVHASVYRCMANNPLGTVISNDVKIRAAVKQFYEIQVYDHYVIQGNTAVLSCQIPPFVQEYVVFKSWEREHHKGTETIAENGRYSMYHDGVLHVRDVRRDAPPYLYRCRTQHQLTGEIKRSVSAGKITVTEQKGSVSPQFAHVLSSVEAWQGEKIRLPCVAQGLPVPHYRWERLREGHAVPLKLGDRHHMVDGTLIIRNVQIEDSGSYVCVANNSVGVEKAETTLSIVVPLSAYIQPEHQEVDEGKSATFACTTSGHPVTFVSWIKDGRFLAMDDRVKLLSREILRIEDVSRKDRGMYQCIARNDRFSVQASAELKLGDSAPVFLDVFREQTIQAGASLSLKCEASGNPPLVAKWTLDDMEIPSANFVNIKEDIVSYVNISRATTEDGGEYACLMSNTVGNIEHSARINVHGLPFVRIMPNISAVAGRDAILRCRVAGYPIDSIHWEKDGHTLPTNHRQKVFSNGTLIIQEVNRIVDAGRYACIVTNHQGKSAQREVHLSVLNAPVINPFSFPTNLRVGVRAGVQCLITEGDQPISITWLKDDRPIQSDMGITTKALDELTRSLIISSITPWHNGNYTCVASNAADSVWHTAQLRVNVPPRWTTEPRNSSVIQQQSHWLDCQAEGSPTPTITWKKAIGRRPRDYKLVTLLGINVQEARNGSLLIRNAQEVHEGYYLCQVSNGVGPELSKVIYLDVQVPVYFESKLQNQSVIKSKDARLFCTAKGDDPVTIEWKTAEKIISPNSPRFIIKERADIQGFTSELVILRVDRQDTNVYHCDANNPFGHDSAKIYLLVKESPEAPKNPTVLTKSSRHARVSWTSPFDGNSPILRYIIQYKSNNEPWDKALNTTVSGIENSVTIKGLRPATIGSIRIFAENDIGIGAPSSTIFLTMEEEAPEGTPQNVNIEALDSKSLKVTWKPPRKELWNGDIQGYHIGYREHEVDDPYTFKTHLVSTASPEQRIEYVITDLKKFHKYDVVLEVYNLQGIGPRTTEYFATTLEDPPSKAPPGIKCTTLSSQAVRLEWESPPSSSIHGLLRGYKISYQLLGFKEVFTKTTMQQSLVLEDLDKFCNYTVQVCAFNGAGDGVFSAPVICSTDEDVPGPPAEIKALVMSSDAILLAWRPPYKPNGIITKYTVYIKVNGHFDTVSTKIKPLSHTLQPTQLYYEGRGLEEEVNYEFWTTASTSVGEGQSTDIVSQSPTSIVPASIASFPERIEVDRKADVKMECRAVGIPTPDREWRIRGERFNERSRFRIDYHGTLYITSSRVQDTNNYTCRVTNIYAMDEITYELLVKGPIGKDAPPPAPILEVKSKSEHSLQLVWSVDDDGGKNPVLGFTLYHKESMGDWSDRFVEADNDTFTLTNLKCGTSYQFYIMATNQIGTSEPSDMVLSSTKGSPPEKPSRDALLRVNTTSINLDFNAWLDGGCPITNYDIEYRAKEEHEWHKVVHDPNHQKHVIVAGLRPETSYTVSVTAKNDAGRVTIEYTVVTLPESFEKSLSDYSHDGSSSAHLLGYLDLGVIIPVATTAGIVIATIAVICLAFQCRRYILHKTGPGSVILSTGRGGETKLSEGPSSSKIEVGKSPTSNPSCYRDNGVHDDICPYATYQLPTTCNDLASMQLRTFSHVTASEDSWQPNKVTSKLLHSKKEQTRLDDGNGGTHRKVQGNSVTSLPPAFDDSSGQTPDAIERKESLLQMQPYCQTTLTPSAPPASEGDSSLTDSDNVDGHHRGTLTNVDHYGHWHNPTVTRSKQFHHVPDLLYHRQDSSSSNDESLHEGDDSTLTKENVGSSRGQQFVKLQPRTSLIRHQSSSSETSPEEPSQNAVSEPLRAPPAFADMSRESEISQTDSKKSSAGVESHVGMKPKRNLAAEEEELIALLKR